MEDKELTQWEYKTIEAIKVNEETLNKLGEQGWEATENVNQKLVLKRPKEKKPSQGYDR